MLPQHLENPPPMIPSNESVANPCLCVVRLNGVIKPKTSYGIGRWQSERFLVPFIRVGCQLSSLGPSGLLDDI